MHTILSYVSVSAFFYVVVADRTVESSPCRPSGAGVLHQVFLERLNMIGKISDNQLIRSVTQKIMQKCAGSGCRINVAIANGYVTLTGTIENEYQRRPFMNAASGINGVRRVIDQTTIAVKKKRV